MQTCRQRSLGSVDTPVPERAGFGRSWGKRRRRRVEHAAGMAMGMGMGMGTGSRLYRCVKQEPWVTPGMGFGVQAAVAAAVLA